MINLSQQLVYNLKNGKNLLAFSHGVDSTALFYILDEAKICFDMAMVDYNIRSQSKDEIASAKELANKFNKKIFILSINLKSGNFEANARDVRYEFFKEICIKHGYKNLILAHQLDDRLEWFMMQLSRGAGLVEMLGMSECESRGWCDIYRPLLKFSRSEISEFLDSKKVRYFIDESNADERFSRNFIRARFSREFLLNFKNGVLRSFEILENDRVRLQAQILHISHELYAIKNNENFMRGVDRVAKKLGVVMSMAQRDECQRCLENSSECVISGRLAVGLFNGFILLSPYIKVVMDKKFKEKCRILGIPTNIRGYIFDLKIDLNSLKI